MYMGVDASTDILLWSECMVVEKIEQILSPVLNGLLHCSQSITLDSMYDSILNVSRMLFCVINHL